MNSDSEQGTTSDRVGRLRCERPAGAAAGGGLRRLESHEPGVTESRQVLRVRGRVSGAAGPGVNPSPAVVRPGPTLANTDSELELEPSSSSSLSLSHGTKSSTQAGPGGNRAEWH